MVEAIPPVPPALLTHKECKERMKHMLLPAKGKRIFLACLKDRINALSENGDQL